MSFPCTKGMRECDGCMQCEKPAEVVGTCAQCREAVLANEEYYDIESELIHWDCLREWAKKYEK